MISNMDYNLCKELKEAGFPQPDVNIGKGCWVSGDIGQDGAYSPTLSELIEACGEMFEYMERIRGGTIPELKWSAVSTNVEKYNISYGHTPEEAVANLYLAINKTKQQ